MNYITNIQKYSIHDGDGIVSGVTIRRRSDLKENFSTIRKNALDAEPVQKSVRRARFQ